MTHQDPGQVNKTPPAAAGAKQVLLLSDDGRMLRLLSRVHPGRIFSETSVLEGIVQLGLASWDLVLLNAEKLEQKTIQAVRALRGVNREIPLVLYGGACGEIYAREALKNGADDYLVWPVTTREIRNLLAGKKPRATIPQGRLMPAYAPGERIPSTTEGQDDTADHERREEFRAVRENTQYCKLAQFVPQGEAELVRQAEAVLAEDLQVEWVRIDADESPVPSDIDPDCPARPIPPGRNVPLMGPRGLLGQLVLGPDKRGSAKVPFEQAACFVGTLIHLCRRDAALKHLATTDELTGVFNRRYLEHFARQVIEQSKHEHTEVTLLLFDIDEFKHYNDTYGHAAGDEILRESTQLLRRCCREHDVVARMGGDEFAVLFWDTGRQRRAYDHHKNGDDKSLSADDSEKGSPPKSKRSHPEMVMFMSNRFRRLMMTNEFPGLGPESRRGILTISGGLAGYPWDGRTVEELIARADEALLNAKRAGKNRIYLIGQPD